MHSFEDVASTALKPSSNPVCRPSGSTFPYWYRGGGQMLNCTCYKHRDQNVYWLTHSWFLELKKAVWKPRASYAYRELPWESRYEKKHFSSVNVQFYCLIMLAHFKGQLSLPTPFSCSQSRWNRTIKPLNIQFIVSLQTPSTFFCKFLFFQIPTSPIIILW